MKILLIEDDIRAAEFLAQGLRESGHIIDHAVNGIDGLHLALTEQYDAVIADRMLPGRDGLTIVRMLRADGKSTPVLILSALGEVDDRVAGLQAGADDYLIKPFAFSELLARLDALTRRKAVSTEGTTLRIADLVLDLQKQKATRAGKSIRLQPQEFRLLEYFMRHPEQIITRTMLLERVWDLHFDPQTNVVDVQVSRVRSKIDKGFNPPLLHTIRGVGYRFGEAEL